MRRLSIALAFFAALISAWVLPVEAQQNGIVIENNGIDSTDSAVGADNVNISRNPGNSQAREGAGVNNQTARAVREPKDRGRQDRGGEAAPTGDYAAPAEGDNQDYTEGGEYVEPVAVPQENVVPGDATATTLRLPNTGSGIDGSFPLAATGAGLAALALGAVSLRRRQAS